MSAAGRRGPFVVFEGPEGAGKSTQATRLADRLRERGRDPLLTREPGGTPAADRIRAVILDPSLRIDPLPEFLLYAASRAQHVAETIRPALDAGRVVICDRFTASSVAYQGHGRGLDAAFVRSINDRATERLRPDLTVLLDLSVEEGRRRLAGRGRPDRLEAADAAFHERVRQGFLAQAAQVQGQVQAPAWLVLDATRPEDDLAGEIWDAVRRLRHTMGAP